MIIVAGKIYVHTGMRDAFLADSASAMVEARRTEGCRDFVVAGDPLEEDRVNIYEQWESREALTHFRASGPGEDLSAKISRAEVDEYVVHSNDA
ncbi:MAG: putative quinol monooxygenase [Burkholderiaceae bacterium]